jgi:hypothetical protein
MAEVTYYVALPFVASDDGIAAGEPALRRCHAWKATSVPSHSVAQVIPLRAISVMAKVIRKFGNVPDDLSAL